MQRKEVHLHLDSAKTKYWVPSENDLIPAFTEEEEEMLKMTAHRLVDEALAPYLAEGWLLDGPRSDAVFLERRVIERPRYSLFAHEHFAAVVKAIVRLRK